MGVGVVGQATFLQHPLPESGASVMESLIEMTRQ